MVRLGQCQVSRQVRSVIRSGLLSGQVRSGQVSSAQVRSVYKSAISDTSENRQSIDRKRNSIKAAEDRLKAILEAEKH